MNLEEKNVVAETPETDNDRLQVNVSFPLEMMEGKKITNLENYMHANKNILEKALGTKVFITLTDKVVTVSLFEVAADPEKIDVYTDLIYRIQDMTSKMRSVSRKEKETDNEKYTFRCMLIRLGYVGKEYKKQRKILLERLEGCSAFRKGRP